MIGRWLGKSRGKSTDGAGRKRLEGRVRVGEVFRQATCVVEQHSDSDCIAAFSGHQTRQVVSDGRVETELSALDLLQDRGGGEGLADAPDVD